MPKSKIPHFTVDGAHYKSDDGMRLTDCCAVFSTYEDGMLCCKKCWREVEVGQGDGCEYYEKKPNPVAYHISLDGKPKEALRRFLDSLGD